MAEGFNVNNFRAELSKTGVMKNNKFFVRMYSPRGFSSTGNRDANILASTTVRFLEFWCEATNIPGVSLSTTEVRRYGYGAMEKKPYVTLSNDITMSFIGDAKGIIWSYFQQWIRLIVNYDMRKGIIAENGILRNQSPFELAYKEDYAVDIHISVFDDAGNESIHVVLRDAYPTFVGDIQLNWGDTNSLMRVPVTFSFFDWYNEKLTLEYPRTTQPGATGNQLLIDTINNAVTAITSLGDVATVLPR
jgi:hypothetical protein